MSSTIMAGLAIRRYTDAFEKEALKFFEALLDFSKPIRIGQREEKVLFDLRKLLSSSTEEDLNISIKCYLDSGFLFPIGQSGNFLIFESKEEIEPSFAEFLRTTALDLVNPDQEIKFLKQQISYVEESSVITANPQMLRIVDIARHVASTDVPVLILGETGVGKEVIAKFIHEQSDRSDGPFVKVSCAALPHELLESELFGYERGAFTGAVRDHAGKFEQAEKGTLLLDEIGEMSPHLQAKLLHVLQDGEFSRLGGKKPVRVNVRVLAATNKKLNEAVLKGEFRADLYFRLNVIKFEIPPLRDRLEDILLLGNYLLDKYRERYKSQVTHFPPELIEAFIKYDWPGNVRQLENVVKRFLILPDVDTIELLGPTPQNGAGSVPAVTHSLKEVAAKAAEIAEKEVVLRMLEETGWNRKEAARRLKICYKALRNKMKKWQMVRNKTYMTKT